jgi:hypothetical protein
MYLGWAFHPQGSCPKLKDVTALYLCTPQHKWSESAHLSSEPMDREMRRVLFPLSAKNEKLSARCSHTALSSPIFGNLCYLLPQFISALSIMRQWENNNLTLVTTSTATATAGSSLHLSSSSNNLHTPFPITVRLIFQLPVLLWRQTEQVY